MKKFKKIFSLLLVFCLMFSMSVSAFAKNYPGDDLSGIQPQDNLTLPRNTIWATLTASWGVRVRFVDWDETLLKEELVPVTDTTPGSSSAPPDPTRPGYIFDGWERYDTNDGPATLNDDGTVTGVNGPGPIVFIATYVHPEIEVTKKSDLESGETASLGQTLTYTVTVKNTGDVTISDITVEDELPEAKLADSETGKITSLAPGDSADVHFTYVVTEADILAESVKNTATASGSDPNGDPVEDDGDWEDPTEDVHGEIVVTKVSNLNGKTAKLGNTITYTVTVTNTGNVTVSNIKVADELSGAALAPGESDTIESLAPGRSAGVRFIYSVTEDDILNGRIRNVASASGTDPKGNTVEDRGEVTDPTEGYGNLTISKNVVGELGDTTKNFTFTVDFNANGTFRYIGSKSGTISRGGSIQLKHGESITIVDIPAGTSYRVTESDNTGYSVSASGDTGTISVGKTSAARFTNYRSNIPKTGDDSNILLWLSLMGISALSMAGVLSNGRKKRRVTHLSNK